MVVSTNFFSNFKTRNTMVIGITNLKGGVGKTIVSQNIAVCLANQNYSVCLVDTDTNQNSVSWAGLREENQSEVFC